MRPLMIWFGAANTGAARLHCARALFRVVVVLRMRIFTLIKSSCENAN